MKRIKVRTRPRTMSGWRGGMVLSLEACDAKAAIEKRWADPVEDEEQQQEPRGKRKGAA